MSNFVTQFSSGSVAVDAGFVAMIISMALACVATSIRLNVRHNDDVESKYDFEVAEIVALIMCAISLALLATAGIVTDTSMTVAQCILVILASVACVAPFIVNFVLTRLRHDKEQSDSDA